MLTTNTASGCVAKPNPHISIVDSGRRPYGYKGRGERARIDLLRCAAGGDLGPMLPTLLYTASCRHRIILAKLPRREDPVGQTSGAA